MNCGLSALSAEEGEPTVRQGLDHLKSMAEVGEGPLDFEPNISFAHGHHHYRDPAAPWYLEPPSLPTLSRLVLGRGRGYGQGRVKGPWLMGAPRRPAKECQELAKEREREKGRRLEERGGRMGEGKGTERKKGKGKKGGERRKSECGNEEAGGGSV